MIAVDEYMMVEMRLRFMNCSSILASRSAVFDSHPEPTFAVFSKNRSSVHVPAEP